MSGTERRTCRTDEAERSRAGGRTRAGVTATARRSRRISRWIFLGIRAVPGVLLAACLALLGAPSPDASATGPAGPAGRVDPVSASAIPEDQGGDLGAVDRELTIVAHQYGYTPHRFVVGRGETVRLRLVSTDVVHGFYLEGHDLEAEVLPGRHGFKLRHPSQGDELTEAEEVVFTAGRPGKYRYRCSVTCGTLHPFMQGEMIVRPNRPYHAGLLGVGAVALGFFAVLLRPAGRRRRRDDPAPDAGQREPRSSRPSEPGGPTGPDRPRRSGRIDLLARLPWLDFVVRRRWFQFALVAPMAVALFFFLIAGTFGSPIGNRNIIVTIVWIFWWFVLITLLVPFGGRVWCTACPIPALGEWLARRRLIGVRPEAEGSKSLRTGSLNRRWPKRFATTWIPNLLFLTMCSVSTILVTRPATTALVLGLMVIAAAVVHAVWRRRSFCRYLCPLNAWMSLYSMASMTEIRTRDPEICATCKARSCVRGTEDAWRCPWLEIPFQLDRNNYCGLCMECVKACPNRNLTLKARPPFADTEVRGLDEAWMAFIMIALVAAYSVTLLGPWGFVRTWANVTESGDWAGFALHTAAVWTAALVVVPGLWYLGARSARWLAHRREGDESDRSETQDQSRDQVRVEVRTIFVRSSYVLVPLGLMAWIAFSLPLILVNYTHITGSLSDPLGWGWDLFGTAAQAWRPLAPEWIPLIQVPLLLAGLALALARGAGIARQLYPEPAAAARSLLPHGLLCAAMTVALLRLFVG